METLIKKYPNVDATIFTGGKKVGVNPKINNMYPGYANAKYEYILISDSGIRSKYWSKELFFFFFCKSKINFKNNLIFFSERRYST